MDYDESRVAEATLALMYLGVFDDAAGHRTWKSFDWAALKQLHELGYISDPVNKNKSVWFTEEGFAKSRELFREFFGIS